MFEFEVNHATILGEDYAINIAEQYYKQNPIDISTLSLLNWEEHCTECAMPDCFETCDLYERRKDGKCRRFVDGISSLFIKSNTIQNFIAKIKFKRWGVLIAQGNINQYQKRNIIAIEKLFNGCARFISIIPDEKIILFGKRGVSSRLFRRLKNLVLSKFLIKSDMLPNYFMIEIINTEPSAIGISLTMRNINADRDAIPFQKLINVEGGFNRILFPFDEIANLIDINEKFSINLTPNILERQDEGRALYFGLNTFIRIAGSGESVLAKTDKQKLKTIKIMVWDLDNTVWDGILTEAEPGQLQLKPEIKNIIEELDRRGIVNSIISKNSYDHAIDQLKKFDIEEYFVFPRITWGAKGESMKQLIRDFNVGEDTVGFIDDSPFERDEVKAINPLVRVYKDDEYLNLLNKPEFNPEVSTESSKRRYFYIRQGKRNEALASFSGAYLDFIKNSEIKLNIRASTEENVDRIQELIQRTNQLNFSGNRYSREQIIEILNSNEFDNYCIDCNDKYGEYGVVGFCLIDKADAKLIDLMFSCRVQSKRVEHAFLSFLMEKYRQEGFSSFKAEITKTEKNLPAIKVFDDLKFEEQKVSGQKYIYQFDLNKQLPENDLIFVNWIH